MTARVKISAGDDAVSGQLAHDMVARDAGAALIHIDDDVMAVVPLAVVEGQETQRGTLL